MIKDSLGNWKNITYFTSKPYNILKVRPLPSSFSQFFSKKTPNIKSGWQRSFQIHADEAIWMHKDGVYLKEELTPVISLPD